MFAKFGSSPKEHPQSHHGAGWSSQHLVWSLSPHDVIWTVRPSRVSFLTFSLLFLMQLACSAAQLPLLWFPIADTCTAYRKQRKVTEMRWAWQLQKEQPKSMIGEVLAIYIRQAFWMQRQGADRSCQLIHTGIWD